MKTAISIPDEVFARADELAHRLGWSRSQLYTHAIGQFVATMGDDPVTLALDALADELGESPAPPSGRALIESGHWEW